MDLRSGHPYWLVRNGLPHSFPALDQDVTCDVVVVGGGITGALIGHHLTEAGVSAMVLDKRDIAWGSTAASTALLQYEIDYPLHELQEMIGHDHATRCYQACRDGIQFIRDIVADLNDSCGFALRPSLYMARHRRDLDMMQREFAARREAGFDVDWWDQYHVESSMGFARPCGIYSREGAQVDAYALTYHLLKTAEGQGLRVHDRTTALTYKVHRSGVHVQTDRGPLIKAKYLVFATGYEQQEIVKRKLVSLKSSFAIVSEPMPGEGPLWHEDCLIWERANPYLYVRTTDDRRVMIGGEDEMHNNPDKRDAQIARKSKTLLRKFAKLFPKMPVEVAFAWAGTFGETKDGLPFVDHFPDSRRIWYALGFGGNGITYSAIAAEMIRAAVLEKASPYDGLFTFGR